jgi:IS30 family transposase
MKERIPMDQCKCSAESRTFQHLSPFERGEIKALSGEGLGVSAIAARIGRDKATAGRETERGTARRLDGDSAERFEYFAETGGAAHEKNRKNCRKPLKIAECPDFMAFADEKSGEGRSPDAVAGRAKLEPELSGKPALCAKTLYNYIDLGIMSIKNIDLALKVRRKPKSKKVRQSKRALGAGIEDRPEAAEAREEFGHWEIDSVIGKKSGKSAVPAIVERKARNQIAAEPAAGEIAGGFGEADGGFGEATGGAFKSAVYFRHPHSSFEKGASERRSGLPRRFTEKGGSAGDMPAQLISKAADWNNNLPRKILGCKIPSEMSEIEILKTAQGAV